MPLFTPDRRYIVVRDRLWRASNPALADSERDEHTRTLMAARRAIRDALKSADIVAEASARRQVDNAKRALGERGPVWWSDGAPDLNRHKIENTDYRDWWRYIATIRSTILELLDNRKPHATICPSEVARAVRSEGWRKLMPDIREVARELAREGAVRVTQKGKQLPTEADWTGPVRIARSEETVE